MQQTDLGPGLSTKRTRRREFLAQIDLVVPWSDLVGLVLPYASQYKTGSPPFDVHTILRIHFMQHWFALSDRAMEDAPKFATFLPRSAPLGLQKSNRNKNLDALQSSFSRMLVVTKSAIQSCVV